MKTIPFLLPTALALAACGGPSRSEHTGAPNKPWRDQTHDERMVTMKQVVWPAMKSEFAAFDPKEFGNVTCGTCHGPGAKDKTFKMPNPKLPKLPATEVGFEKLKKEQPDVVHFMMSTVVPKMADFVGEPPYDPKTGKGFGCFRCHPKEGGASN
ncbi:MAG: hypothetical protein JO332_05265 [Planctomycetaceae bacterium]|nr:hypothetical protein [Planctomycetaceae bacterium]